MTMKEKTRKVLRRTTAIDADIYQSVKVIAAKTRGTTIQSLIEKACVKEYKIVLPNKKQ